MHDHRAVPGQFLSYGPQGRQLVAHDAGRRRQGAAGAGRGIDHEGAHIADSAEGQGAGARLDADDGDGTAPAAAQGLVDVLHDRFGLLGPGLAERGHRGLGRAPGEGPVAQAVAEEYQEGLPAGPGFPRPGTGPAVPGCR